MKHTIAVATLLALGLAAPALGGSNGTLTGDYVEARTAEVFTGGCIMGSEAETMGRQAVLAWRVASGAYEGVALDGLAVVAAVAGDRNLGIREIGGGEPVKVKAEVIVDERATPAQRDALVAAARAMSRGLLDGAVTVTPAPITFVRDTESYTVKAGDAALAVATEVTHSPAFGAMQWFHPLAAGTKASIGLTRTQVYWGAALGSRWRQEDKRSSFFGTFSF
jgi:hypothetical protein